MTYLAQETSQEDGQPVELYTFNVGGEMLYYTSSDVPHTVSANTFEPVAVSRGEIAVSPEDRGRALEIELPSADPIARRYIVSVPGQRTKLTIQRLHYTDTPTPEVITIFQGFVRAVGFMNNANVAKVSVIPIEAAGARTIPRFTFQGLCNHVLYDSRCQVDPNSLSFRHDAVVTGISGNTIDVDGADGFASGFFTAGFVNTATDSRMILAHSGTTLTLMLPFGVDPTGATVTVRAGCDHSLVTCFSKFNNVVNYGGFSFIPTRNVFDSGLE